jgi:hypothetical protein
MRHTQNTVAGGALSVPDFGGTNATLVDTAIASARCSLDDGFTAFTTHVTA